MKTIALSGSPFKIWKRKSNDGQREMIKVRRSKTHDFREFQGDERLLCRGLEGLQKNTEGLFVNFQMLHTEAQSQSRKIGGCDMRLQKIPTMLGNSVIADWIGTALKRSHARTATNSRKAHRAKDEEVVSSSPMVST